jgi:hypothetical protein
VKKKIERQPRTRVPFYFLHADPAASLSNGCYYAKISWPNRISYWKLGSGDDKIKLQTAIAFLNMLPAPSQRKIS